MFLMEVRILLKCPSRNEHLGLVLERLEYETHLFSLWWGTIVLALTASGGWPFDVAESREEFQVGPSDGPSWYRSM